MKTCSVHGCTRSRVSRGFCAAHYKRWRKLGNATDLRLLKRRPAYTNNIVDRDIQEAKEARRPARHIMRPGRDNWDED